MRATVWRGEKDRQGKLKGGEHSGVGVEEGILRKGIA